MAVSTTPVFDSEILRLRRRLGDIFNDDGSELTSTTDTTSPSWVGFSSTTGGAWKRDELVDIYNRSVWSFLDYITSVMPSSRWYEFVNGYIFYKSGITISSGKIDLSTLDPVPYRVIDVAINLSPSPSNQMIEIPPSEYLSSLNGFVKTKKPIANNVMLYTVMSDGTLSSNSQSIFILPNNQTGTVNLVYLRRHTNLVHNGSLDMFGVSSSALQRILVFAEIEAKKSKYLDSQNIASQILQTQSQLDILSNQNK